MQEIWKDINEYEGLYQVSNLGRLKSIGRYIVTGNRKRFMNGKILNGTKNENGYMFFALRKGGQYKSFKIHRLVATAFIDNPEQKRTVNHKNSIKDDNRVENLEWATHSENHLHSYKIGKRKPALLGKSGILSQSGKCILQFTKTGLYEDFHLSARMAEKSTGISHKHIGDVCVGRRKTTGGFIWRFAT